MLTGAEDFCEKCKKTLCNSVMSLFREKIATNDRPMVVLLNFVFTGLSCIFCILPLDTAQLTFTT